MQTKSSSGYQERKEGSSELKKREQECAAEGCEANAESGMTASILTYCFQRLMTSGRQGKTEEP